MVLHLRSILLLVFAGIFIGCSSTQRLTKRGYESGYVITKQGDTLPGYVKDRSREPFVEIYNRIRFYPENGRGKSKIRPDQILGYGIGDRHYESFPIYEDAAFFRFRYYIESSAPFTFLRVIRRDGNLTWYEQEFVHDDNNFVDSFPLFHLEGDYEMVRVTQGLLGLKRKRLMEYFHDCEPVVDAISSKQLRRTDELYDFILDHCFADAVEAE